MLEVIGKKVYLLDNLQFFNVGYDDDEYLTKRLQHVKGFHDLVYNMSYVEHTNLASKA
jgi:hypothetical protein